MTLPPLAPNPRLRWDAIEPYLADLPGDARILELGSGGGAVATRLARLGTYVGVEPDEQSLALARSRLLPPAKVVPSIDDVNLHDFDLLCSFEVLEHLEDDLGELRRWLTRVRPSGTVIVSVPAHRHRFATHDKIVGHFRRYDPADLARLLRDAGLVDIEVHAYGFPLGYPLEWIRNILAVGDARRLRSPEPTDLSELTARSGRLRQPRAWMSLMIDIATWPFRMLQRANPSRHLGTGLIGRARVRS